MKRNLLLLAMAGAFGMALLASASRALATCPTGSTGTQLNGNYAIKVVGAKTDLDDSSGDPVPAPIAGIGVIAADGACDITGGEFIYNDDETFTSPTTVGSGGPAAFSGSLTANIVAGTGSPATNSNYYFNVNNAGVLTLVDSASGNTFQFAIAFETGNTAFRGARLNPGDPLGITGELQAGVTLAQFENPSSILFDGIESNDVSYSYLGLGSFPVELASLEHLDPETNTVIEGGGNTFWNNDNGYYDGGQTLPSGGGPLNCDFHQTVVSGPSTADGTQVTNSVFNNDFSCPFSGLDLYVSTVVWGSANQYSYDMITGFVTGLGPLQVPVGTGTGGKVTATGTDHLSAASVTLTASVSNPNPSTTLTITNDSAEPLDYTGLTLSSGLSDVTITGGTCNTTGADVPANGVLSGPGSCTIILTDSGASCTTTGPNFQSGTLEINGNDHAFATGTQTSTGLTIPVTCK